MGRLGPGAMASMAAVGAAVGGVGGGCRKRGRVSAELAQSSGETLLHPRGEVDCLGDIRDEQKLQDMTHAIWLEVGYDGQPLDADPTVKNNSSVGGWQNARACYR